MLKTKTARGVVRYFGILGALFGCCWVNIETARLAVKVQWLISENRDVVPSTKVYN